MKAKVARIDKADEIEKRKLLREDSVDLKLVLPLQLRTVQTVCVKKLPKTKKKTKIRKVWRIKYPEFKQGRELFLLPSTRLKNLVIHMEH